MSLIDFEISTDRARIDIALVQGLLSTTYWGAGRTLAVVERIVQNSVCFGGYLQGQQVAFGRLITDFAAIAYFADIIVVPECRGRGFGKAIVRSMLEYTDQQGVAAVLLRTRDARGLYEKFGFGPVQRPQEMMRRSLPELKPDVD